MNRLDKLFGTMIIVFMWLAWPLAVLTIRLKRDLDAPRDQQMTDAQSSGWIAVGILSAIGWFALLLWTAFWMFGGKP